MHEPEVACFWKPEHLERFMDVARIQVSEGGEEGKGGGKNSSDLGRDCPRGKTGLEIDDHVVSPRTT